jgi:hypothetical protein
LYGEEGQEPVAVSTVGFPVMVLTKELSIFQVRGSDLALGDELKDPALCTGVAPRRLKLGAVILPMRAQVVSVFNFIEHRPVLPPGLRPIVDQHIRRISTAGTYGILVGNGDGLFLKVSDGGVKIEEHIEISLQCRLKGNATVTPKVDDLTRQATGVLRNGSNRHNVKLILKICESVSRIIVQNPIISRIIVHESHELLYIDLVTH